MPRHRVSPSASPMTGSGEYAAAYRFNQRRLRVLDRPVKPGDPARMRRERAPNSSLRGALATKQSRLTPRMHFWIASLRSQ
ncbi:hypothetical protein CWO91_06325 [Bradyrhizobium genosp. SA-3]|nr:hypothetical protein CWO91_06325 [Bradyrhizobium genosp. SA-3]